MYNAVMDWLIVGIGAGIVLLFVNIIYASF